MSWDPRWRPGIPPDEPVDLWIAVFAGDGAFMGAGPVTASTRWLWRGGRLCFDYGSVCIRVQFAGRYATGLICAVSPQVRVYQPLWPVSLGTPEKLRAGDTITVAGVIGIVPELPGPHG